MKASEEMDVNRKVMERSSLKLNEMVIGLIGVKDSIEFTKKEIMECVSNVKLDTERSI
jgi:hypothetical protein